MLSYIAVTMTAKPNASPGKTITIRPNDADFKLLNSLRKKLGVDPSQIFRLAIRALASKEGLAQ